MMRRNGNSFYRLWLEFEFNFFQGELSDVALTGDGEKSNDFISRIILIKFHLNRNENSTLDQLVNYILLHLICQFQKFQKHVPSCAVTSSISANCTRKPTHFLIGTTSGFCFDASAQARTSNVPGGEAFHRERWNVHSQKLGHKTRED